LWDLFLIWAFGTTALVSEWSRSLPDPIAELATGLKAEFAGAFHFRIKTLKQRLPSKISQTVFCLLIVCCNWMLPIDLMTTVRDRINAHLPIVLEVLRTGSLVVIALSTICASQSLKQMAGGHDAPSEVSDVNKEHH